MTEKPKLGLVITVTAGVTNIILDALLFQTAMVFALPLLLWIDGIWLALAAAEILALTVTGFFFIWKRKQYHYV